MFTRITAIIFLLLASAFAESAVDPTRPLNYSSGPQTISSSLNLESILHSKNRKIAIINQQVLGEGDKIGDIKVTRINPRSVQITQNGVARTLSLPATQVKTSAIDSQQDK